MKKINLITLFFLSAILLINCSSEDDSDSNDNPYNQTSTGLMERFIIRDDGLRVDYPYVYSNGNLTSINAASEPVIAITSNSNHKIIRADAQFGADESYATFEYEGNKLIKQTTFFRLNPGDLVSVNIWEFVYNNEGLVESLTSQDGNGNNSIANYYYDSDGVLEYAELTSNNNTIPTIITYEYDQEIKNPFYELWENFGCFNVLNLLPEHPVYYLRHADLVPPFSKLFPTRYYTNGVINIDYGINVTEYNSESYPLNITFWEGTSEENYVEFNYLQ